MLLTSARISSSAAASSVVPLCDARCNAVHLQSVPRCDPRLRCGLQRVRTRCGAARHVASPRMDAHAHAGMHADARRHGWDAWPYSSAPIVACGSAPASTSAIAVAVKPSSDARSSAVDLRCEVRVPVQMWLG